jgi:DNA-binding MarR family transcriptional regulator
LTEAEVHRLAHGLIAATSPDPGHATEAIRSFRTDPAEADRLSTPASALKPQFTKTQGRYLAFIHRYIEKFGQAPAESDIQRHFLVSAPSVNAMMQTLTRKGFISRVPGVPRSIKLMVPPQALPTD